MNSKVVRAFRALVTPIDESGSPVEEPYYAVIVEDDIVISVSPLEVNLDDLNKRIEAKGDIIQFGDSDGRFDIYEKVGTGNVFREVKRKE